MKKRLKKLVLMKETLRGLERARLQVVGGGYERFTADTCDLNNEVCANHDVPDTMTFCC